MRRFYFEKGYYKSKSEKSFQTYNRKTFAADCIKKKGNGFSIILIRLLLLIVEYFGKRLNHSSETKEITDHKF